MKAITPTHYAVECNLNWLPVPRNLNQNTRHSPARGNERASGDETNPGGPPTHICIYSIILSIYVSIYVINLLHLQVRVIFFFLSSLRRGGGD